MVFTQATLILCASLIVSATSIARRQAGSDYNEISNKYNYPLTWSGRYLEWSGYNAETLQFTSFPTMDTAGEFKTADGNCLILSKSNGFPTVEVGACNGQLFTPISSTNELRIENPPIGVCAEEEDSLYFKACPSEESGELCLGEDEGYASVRPCNGYVAKLLIQSIDGENEPKPTETTEAKKSGTKYPRADVIWYVNVVNDYFDPAASKHHPGFQRLACVQVSDGKWYATETIQHGKTCIANTDRSACKEYNTVSNCRADQYNPEDVIKYNGPDFELSSKGAICLRVDPESTSQYKGMYIRAFYDQSTGLTNCMAGDEVGRCDTYANGENCFAKLIKIPEDVSDTKECADKDQSNESSWCHQVEQFMTFYNL